MLTKSNLQVHPADEIDVGPPGRGNDRSPYLAVHFARAMLLPTKYSTLHDYFSNFLHALKHHLFPLRRIIHDWRTAPIYFQLQRNVRASQKATKEGFHIDFEAYYCNSNGSWTVPSLVIPFQEQIRKVQLYGRFRRSMGRRRIE